LSKKQVESLERIYTVPLTQAWITARHKRTKRAVKVLREFAEHHMKSSEIKIDTKLNERLWNRGITKPPRKITVRMVKDEDDVITISLPKEEKPTGVSDLDKLGQPALPEKKEEALPEEKREALPAATEEKKEEPVTPSPKKAKTPAKKKAPAKKKPAAKKKN
jgi:large subunit ribosomal protein L31e